ncbi:MAG: hypothetical protein ABI601_01520 [bacterium]
MPDQPTDAGGFPADRSDNPDVALGGADAVPKTTYVTGQGGEPEARHAHGEKTPGRSTASASPNTVLLVLAFFLVAAVLVYLLGFGR